MVFSPSEFEPCEVFLPEETLPTEVGCPYLSTSQVFEVVPVKVGPAVVICVDQLVSEHIVHVPLREDVVLTQHNLIIFTAIHQFNEAYLYHYYY